MKIAIIGSGNVGGALAQGWAKAGHEITFGVRNLDEFKANRLREMKNITALLMSDAVAKSEVVVIAAIPQAVQARIFEAFTAAQLADEDGEPTRMGIGLGLAVTHHLVKLHGGRIGIESRAGRGTICHVYLPLAETESSVGAALHPLGEDDVPLESILTGVVDNSSDLVQRAARFMQLNHDQMITSADLANELGVSADYVARLFRRETGMSPRQYLNRYRMVAAQRLLLADHLSVTEIAAEVGFNDAAYFSRIFRQETGKSPQAFRKNAN